MGPETLVGDTLHKQKYRLSGESFEESTGRIADTLADNRVHFEELKDILRGMRFLPGGRVQAAIGAPKAVTPYNCFVSGVVEDSMGSIMQRAAEAAETMRMGGGIGYDFSRLRPRGDRITSLDSQSSGPVSFMGIYDAVCKTIASSGHRRGAQMGVLRVDHPDIEEFIHSKQNDTQLTAFNISVGITDEFMEAVKNNQSFVLRFQGRAYKSVSARSLWDQIMRSTWSYAEPGVLFLDTINKYNNLWYCEQIEATNPCAEQPLPPNGACLLGSFNLTRYVTKNKEFDYGLLAQDVTSVVRAMDNVVDEAVYPLEAHRQEALSKRRMGLGITGLANTGEYVAGPYGSAEFNAFQRSVMQLIMERAYYTSALLAREKGAFPLFDKARYLEGKFIQTLPSHVKDVIFRYGIRNSHLLSIAPTGTISLSADNVSSGIEPTFSERYERTIQTFDGPRVELVEDYAVRTWGIKPKTADKCTVEDHLAALLTASKYVDSAVSKTCNIGDNVTWDEFKQVYTLAYRGGSKGCTTFRAAGYRKGIMNTQKDAESGEEHIACTYDPDTGERSCDS